MIEKLRHVMGLDSTPAAGLTDFAPGILAPHTVAEAEAKLKGAQLMRGRTRAKVDALMLELNAANKILANEKRIIGKQMVDGVPIASEALRPAKERVQQLQCALDVAREKDEAALRELRHAELLVSVEGELCVLARVKFSVLPKLDSWLLEGERLLRDEVLPSLKDASASATIDRSWISAVQIAVEIVKKPLIALIPGASSLSPSRDGKTLADRVPDPEFIRARRTKQQAKTPCAATITDEVKGD